MARMVGPGTNIWLSGDTPLYHPPDLWQLAARLKVAQQRVLDLLDELQVDQHAEAASSRDSIGAG
jgi:hypothetical protein